MAKELRLRRGDTAASDAFIGSSAELTVDTQKKQVRLHDGITPGGFPLVKEADLAGPDGSDKIEYLAEGDGVALRTVKSKLSERISISDSTPLKDGITSDTTKLYQRIQKASTDGGGTVFIDATPSGYGIGRHVVGSQRGIPIPPNVSLKGDNTKLVLRDNMEWFLLGRPQDYGDTTFVSFYGITPGVDYAQIVADTTTATTAYVVSSGHEAAFTIGDLVYIRLGQAEYDSAEPVAFMFAKVLSTSPGVVTVDRPAGYAMSVAATTNTRQRRIIKVNGLSENITIDGFNLVNPATGNANAEFGVHFRYARNIQIRNLRGTNVGPGIVGGQFGENIQIDNVFVDGCVAQGQLSKGRAFSFAECKTVAVTNYRAENFANVMAFIEGGSENVRFEGGVVVNNFPGRASTNQIFFLAGAEDLIVDGLTIEGNPCTILETSIDTYLIPPYLFNVDIARSVAPTWSAVSNYFHVDHVGYNVKLGDVFNFTQKKTFTLEINLLASQGFKQFRLPNGVITKMTVCVTNKTGVTACAFARDSGANPVPSAGGSALIGALTNNTPFTLPKTNGYPFFICGGGHPFSNPEFQRFFFYQSNGDVVAGSKIYVTIDYFPSSTPLVVADSTSYMSVT